MRLVLIFLLSLYCSEQLQLKQMLAQEKELEISISHQEQQEHPLENIETYLVAQLERSHESLELELLQYFDTFQVFADAVDGTQTLDCDATVQKQHRLLFQYSQAHITTVRTAIKNINDSLQGLTQREQDVKVEAVKSRELATLLQDVLSKMKSNGAEDADENRIFAEKLEKEITDLKSRQLQLDFKLSALKIEDQTNKATSKLLESKLELVELKNSQIWKEDVYYT
ncbi:hypothetical protein B566_EDAN010221 [Ephemera danica]|nr:hypothetical protein B566_EDAN010221 [Ephemera danica]